MQAEQQCCPDNFGHRERILKQHREYAGAEADQRGPRKLQVPMFAQNHAPTAGLPIG